MTTKRVWHYREFDDEIVSVLEEDLIEHEFEWWKNVMRARFMTDDWLTFDRFIFEWGNKNAAWMTFEDFDNNDEVSTDR